MLLATLFFSGMNVCVKMLPRIPTHEIVFFRAVGMGLICWWALQRAEISLRGEHPRDLFLRGFFGTGGLVAYFFTLKHIGFAPAVTLQYLNPIFSSVLAIFILQERVLWFQWLFFGLSCMGVWLVKGFSSQIAPLYLFTGVLSAFFAGLAYNYVRKLRGRDHPLVVVFYFSCVTLVCVGPYTLFHWIWPTLTEWALLGLIGALTYVAQVLMTRAYQSERMSIVSNLNYLGLVYALLLGYFVFHESVSWVALSGMLLIVCGVILGSHKKIHRRLTRQRSVDIFQE